ncbi:MAG: sugar nucleotide-binding protein [Saccharolobus sp.]
MKVALTDEGEIASAIARNLNNEEIIIVDTPAKIIKEKLDIIIHTYEIPIIEAIHNPSLSWTYNAWYAINMARADSKIGSLNIYLSTLMVYDGKKGFYKEHNTPNPLNYYGLSKLSGEILELCL